VSQDCSRNTLELPQPRSPSLLLVTNPLHLGVGQFGQAHQAPKLFAEHAGNLEEIVGESSPEKPKRKQQMGGRGGRGGRDGR